MAPCGARWMYSSLGTSDGSKAHASSPPIATIIIKLNLTVFLLSGADNVEITAFNAGQVRYLIVGGYAVSFHAQPRATKDL
jgi:hypothetical protein